MIGNCRTTPDVLELGKCISAQLRNNAEFPVASIVSNSNFCKTGICPAIWGCTHTVIDAASNSLRFTSTGIPISMSEAAGYLSSFGATALKTRDLVPTTMFNFVKEGLDVAPRTTRQRKPEIEVSAPLESVEFSLFSGLSNETSAKQICSSTRFGGN